MPPLQHPESARAIILPPRRAKVAAETDVLVVGGGPAGIGAALGAAQSGARVILAERYGFLGGNATAALVMPLMSFHTQRGRGKRSNGLSLMPGDHGPGDPVIAGAVRDFVEAMVEAGGAVEPSGGTGYTVPFDPEVFKSVAFDMLDRAGVRFLLHAFASGVIGGAKIEGVVFETKSGPVVIKAKTVVDCTGDADIAAFAGAPYEVGRESDGLVQPMTLMFRMAEFEREAFAGYLREHPDQWRGVHGLWDLIREAALAGELDLPREDILFFATLHERELAVNSTRVTRALGTDVWDLTRAEWEGRRQMRQIAAFLKRYVPGFAESYVMQSGVQVGIRETRRIVGEYQLTASDIGEARKFEDVIARCSYPMDIHNPAGQGTTFRHLPDGEAYDIPLRSLIPQGVDNVLVAGRAISGTHEAFSSYRVMPVSMATGQAAGVCASLAARSGDASRDVAYEAVEEELVKQGVDLGKVGAGV